VHSRKSVLNDTYPESWRENVATQFLKRGVKLVLDDFVDDFEIEDGHITTRGKKTIPADLVVCYFLLVISTFSWISIPRFLREDLVRTPSSLNPLAPMFCRPPGTSRSSLHYSFLTILVSLLVEMPWTGLSRNKRQRPLPM
jgi:hypothetical protein